MTIMKKLFMLTAIAMASTFAGSAQTVVNNPGNTSYFGFRASLDIPCPGDVKVGDIKSDIYKNGIGFSAGFIYNIPVVANFYIEPGVSYYYNATGFKDVKVGDINISEGTMEHASVRQMGMRVPLMFGYHFDFTPDVNLAIFTGPELDVGISSDTYLTGKGLLSSFHRAPSNYSDRAIGFKRNRVDCSWKFGVGFNFVKNYYVGIEGAVGLADRAKGDNISFHENRVGVTLGYNFK